MSGQLKSYRLLHAELKQAQNVHTRSGTKGISNNNRVKILRKQMEGLKRSMKGKDFAEVVEMEKKKLSDGEEKIKILEESLAKLN